MACCAIVGLDYLDLVCAGKVKTSAGRLIPEAPDLPGFCYVLADLTPTMVSRCKKASLTPSQDRLSYFGYNPNYRAYIEVISFDGLIKGAKQRNRAFFEKLGLPV